MKITKKSLITQKIRTIDLPITQEQFDAWNNGALIQDVMPHLSRDEREFLISGTVPDDMVIFTNRENQE